MTAETDRNGERLRRALVRALTFAGDDRDQMSKAAKRIIAHATKIGWLREPRVDVWRDGDLIRWRVK